MKFLLYGLVPCLMLLCCAGCSGVVSAEGSYMSGHNDERSLPGVEYFRKVNYQGVERSPVVVVHGFLGARLKCSETNSNIWGEVSVSGAIRAQTPEQLRNFALPMAQGKPLKQCTDDVVPDGLLTKFKVHFALFEFDVDGYDKLINLLVSAGYQLEGKDYMKRAPYPSLFIYAYDWRRDISENAILLGKFLEEKKALLKQHYNDFYGKGDYNIKFNLIGHSMGGLVSRYFMEYGDQELNPDGPLPTLDWRGTVLADQLIQIGTPNGGYVDTCLELINGLKYAPAAAPFPPGIIGTFHSYYQMMPHPSYNSVLDKEEVVDMYEPQNWVKYGWGLLAENQDRYLQILLPNIEKRSQRYLIALDHLTKCLKKAKQFYLAMGKYAEPPKGVYLRLFLGDSVKTSSKLSVNHSRKRVDVVEYDTGDGKVLASSARASLRELDKGTALHDLSPVVWNTVVHLPGAHMGLIQNNVFKDNIIYYLLASPTPNDTAQIKAKLEKMHK